MSWDEEAWEQKATMMDLGPSECQHEFVMIIFRRGGEEGSEIVCELCRRTPDDIIAALRAENERLADQLSTAGTRIGQLTRRLEIAERGQTQAALLEADQRAMRFRAALAKYEDRAALDAGGDGNE